MDATQELKWFCLKIAAKPYGWLYVTKIWTKDAYEVTRIEYGRNKAQAQKLGKITAEKMAESLRNWSGRRPSVVEIEEQ